MHLEETGQGYKHNFWPGHYIHHSILFYNGTSFAVCVILSLSFQLLYINVHYINKGCLPGPGV